jgi:hydroxymethylglutaryl-CoA reductase
MMAGAVGDEIERLAQVLVEKGMVRMDVADAELALLRNA